MSKRDPDYPAELETQLILRLPEEPAKTLREILKTADNLKNRLSIQIDNDVRNGEVRLDDWSMHAKIVDLPTVVESLKTIDNKSFYKTADICQMMICKTEPDQPATEEETPTKNKKKDPYKVDKKFLFPHGLTPPTKNVRKRRFRKTLKKKCVEAPEIEREVKRLIRADNEALCFTWEVVQEDDDQQVQVNKPEPEPDARKSKKKSKAKRKIKKKELAEGGLPTESSNVVDIFGGAVSDSDLDESNINLDLEDSHQSAYDPQLSDTNSNLDTPSKRDPLMLEFGSQLFHSQQGSKSVAGHSRSMAPTATVVSTSKSGGISSEDDDNMTLRVEQLGTELEKLKQRKQRMLNEIASMENVALKQRFQENLHTLNQDVMFKEMEYQGLLTMLNSEDI